MARKRKQPEAASLEAAAKTDESSSVAPPAALEAPDPNTSLNQPETREPLRIPDPRSIMSASLDAGKGSPRMRLLRSHKFKQMQIAFDQPPDEKYLAMLKEAGWTDRTKSEGIWTKQVASGQWQPVADAERLFKAIANSIRQDKGLEPVLSDLAMA